MSVSYLDNNDWQIVNIKANMPSVDDALRRFSLWLLTAKRKKVIALIIIHGYGSTGVGGKIKMELHKKLAQYKAKGDVKGFIPGERWTIKNAEVRKLLEVVPSLEYDPDLEMGNAGITIVVV